MFALRTPGVAYSDPWLQPLEQRLAALARGRRRVAYYYEEPNNSSFRYRAYNMVQALTEGAPSDVGASYFFRDDLHCVNELAALAEVLVICRSGYDHHVAELIARFRARGRRVLFDVDDFVFDSEYAHLIMNTLAVPTAEAPAWTHWFHYLTSMGSTLARSDGGITTNPFLAERMRRFSGLPVAVVPNFMNREQMALSQSVYQEKAERRFVGDGRVVFGYFSGSPSHRLDFAIVEQALTHLLETDERVHVMLVGYIEPPADWARFGARILHEPFHDYVNLQRLMGTVEVSVVPLQCNVFTNCKSTLKYFEAAAVGTLTVASPTATYAADIRDGDNGHLARAHEWQRKLSEMLAHVDDVEGMARRACDDASVRYAWTSHRSTIKVALGWS